jgi:hypothetical protein
MTPPEIAAAVERGEDVAHQVVDQLGTQARRELIELLLPSPDGRRWLRRSPWLDSWLAIRMLDFAEDFRQTRRDDSLPLLLEAVSDDELVRHAELIAGSRNAAALWSRFGDDPFRIAEVAMAIVAGDNEVAAESTLYLLVNDPIDPYKVGAQRRANIAGAALESRFSGVRGVAAEYLAANNPAGLLARIRELVEDADERVRGFAWTTALSTAQAGAQKLAVELLGSESSPIPVRRSALVALGTVLPT